MIGDESDMREALEQDPTDGAHVPCWSALARVVDKDGTNTWHEGDSNGHTVTVMVLTGPFTGCEVSPMVSTPVGGSSGPIPAGTRLLVHFLEGTVGGMAVVGGIVPGGAENPLPAVVAGVAYDKAVAPERENPGTDPPLAYLFSPPKKVGSKEYYRGAIKVIRLKGLQDDFFSGFVVSADDGSSIEMRWSSFDSSYATVIKDKQGARLSVGSGFASLFSPDGNSSVQVSNGQVLINTDSFQVNAKKIAAIDGNVVCLNMNGILPTPASACAFSVAGPVNVVSTRVFVGL